MITVRRTSHVTSSRSYAAPRTEHETRTVATAALRMAGLGVTIAAAYYAGAAVGFALKLPAATPSVLWPPNAILTSALLLTPVRLWPFALASALPAHIALETGAGWPMMLVLALFVTNCSEALIAAGTLRWLSDAPTRFDSLRRVGIFLAAAVVAAPLLSSFLDAAVVRWFRGEPYWQVWTARLFSNTLTALTVVPAVVTVVRSGRTWLATAPRFRHAEAALLGISMLLLGTFLLRNPGSDPVAAELADRAALAWLLPFLLWAAIRLGPGGLSLTLLASALVLVSAAVHSHGPFQGVSPSDTTLALQVFLIVVSVPLLVVAALVEERRVAQQDLARRLALEALRARLSGAFVHLPSDRMREVFSESLREIGEALELESVMLFECVEPDRVPAAAASWTARGSADLAAILGASDASWPIERLERNEAVLVEPPGDGGQKPEREPAQRRASPCVLLPLIADDRMQGVLACTGRPAPAEDAALVEELRLAARVLASALARKRTEDALRASEAIKSAILSSLTDGVVVVDRDGCVVTVNDRWRQMAGSDAPPTATEPGASYLEFYRAAARSGQLWASEVVDGIEAVLRGATQDFRVEHVRPHPIGDRTYRIRAAPLDRPGGGAVVTHVDLTAQRRAELEAQRARAELAHVSRVATMGALTASLAHQLNQPLTGILANAQAAHRFLAAATPDLEEARASLQDIMDDDRRAGEVIVRMRDLLRKDIGLYAEVDLNGLVSDVARLVSSDAIIRNVGLMLQLDGGPALVRGDRVQLQQVVLNLIVNALEALGEHRARDRRVVVRSTQSNRGFVEVAVIDNGHGFNGTQDSVFEAFYTTKPAGMGLGLSIARSIVEAHAGVISAANNEDGGATVWFRLPRALHDAS